jgi:hypothetical protein
VASLKTVDGKPQAAAGRVPVRERPVPAGAGTAQQQPFAAEREKVLQAAITIVARIKPRQASRLKRLLERMSDDPAGNDVVPFGRLSTTHFARLVVLDRAVDHRGAAVEPQLVYISDVDEPLERHLDELVDVAGDGLDRVFGHCEGYPAQGEATRERRMAFLREHMVGAGAVYVNTVGRTVRQIRQDAELHDAIEHFLDAAGNEWSRREPEEVRAAIQDFVNTRPELAWARAPVPTPDMIERVREIAAALRVPLGLLAVSPVLVPALPVWALVVRLHELRDPAPRLKPDQEHVNRLAALEDRVVQNQFTAVGFLKTGLVRRATAAGVLRLVDYAARHVFNNGNLTGIKTIHFARWVFLDDGRRLIFASNYDGSLESYMDDFIDKVAWGLNAVFSNGYGYPKTSWLLFGGARDELAFKDYLRRHQIPTQVWYSAYPDLTAINIANNAAVRAGLVGSMSREETERWLRRI